MLPLVYDAKRRARHDEVFLRGSDFLPRFADGEELNPFHCSRKETRIHGVQIRRRVGGQDLGKEVNGWLRWALWFLQEGPGAWSI
jgi:hypothetical protein